MIEILEYKQLNKGVLQGVLNIKIPKWGNFIIKEISYFKKDSARWISLPSRMYEKEGKNKYYHFNMFEEPKMLEAFGKKILEALDEYIQIKEKELKAKELLDKKSGDALGQYISNQPTYQQEEIPF